jgi:cyclopropane fatty-acyl-phospholipid synthase-like methyltransferase
VILLVNVEKTVADYYEMVWKIFVQWWDAEETLGLHYAYYEKHTKNFREAILNMNKFVGKLLKLDNEKPVKILDAGCGIGGTSIYLAQKYPNIDFTGITITPCQQKLAKKFAKERKVKNVNFKIKSYLDTEFPSNSFDRIFGLESISYASDKEKLTKEMYRVLKPGGTFVTVDVFFSKSADTPIVKKIHDLVCIGRGMPLDNDLIYSEYKKYLKKQGFKDICMIDMSKNVWKSQARSFIIGIPYMIKTLFKFLLFKNYDPSKDPDFSLAASVICAVYGATGSGKYCAFICKK